MDSNMSKIPCLVTHGFIILVVLGSFTPIPPFLFLPNPTLFILVQLFRLPREMFQPLCPRMSMIALYWLEWMIVSYERTSPTANSLYPSVIPDNKTCSIPAWLVWADWYVINCLEVYLPSGVDSSNTCWVKTNLQAFQFFCSWFPFICLGFTFFCSRFLLYFY